MPSKVSISDLLPKLQGVREYANYYSARCVFHSPDAHPSMLVYKNGWFRCLSCGRSGDFYLLQRKLAGWDSRSMAIQSEQTDWAPNAIKSSDLEATCIEANRMLVDYSDSLSWYLRLRGIEDRIEPQNLGWINGWYTIPIYDFEGLFQGVVMRAGSHVQEASGMRYVSKSKASIYVPDWYLVKTQPYIVVTFGMIDALTLAHMRIPAISSVFGKKLTPADLDWARKPIIFFPDYGEEKEAEKLSLQLGWRGKVIWHNYPKGTKDPNDLYLAGLEVDIMNSITTARSK